MSKMVMLGIVAVILLVGAENLIAQEERDRPEAEQEQKGQVEQLRRPRAGEEAGRARMGGMQQRRRLMAVREVEPERVRALQQTPQRLGQDRPIQEGAGRLLDELTKAYRENDMEKMGQLIRKMHQFRQRVQKVMGAPIEAGPDVRGRPGVAQPDAKKERLERRKAAPAVMEKPGPPIMRRGMGGWGQGMQGRGIGGWGQGMRGRGMMMQGRGMGGWGRGFQGRGRGMGGLGRGLQGRGRGMGGLGRGVPGPWCPWWGAPVPEMD